MSLKKNIFIFDENKCVGCHACSVACMNENGGQESERWRNIQEPNASNHPCLPLFFFSMACNHCEEAPCMYGCPTLSFHKDPSTGAIVHDPDSCIGCKYCSWVCPFDAPKFNSQLGVIEKCTFCIHRLKEDKEPACTQLCPVGALQFGNEEFSSTDARESSPVPVSVGSSLKVIKLRNKNGPLRDFSFVSKNIPSLPENKSHINAKKEWPLLSFSMISVLMIALFLSGNNVPSELTKFLFPVLIFFSAFLSLFHLGKKRKAWMSVLNVERSWLSREILFFTFFVILLIIDTFIIKLPYAAIAVNAILLLISIDILYLPVTWRWKLKLHSGQAIFIGASLVLLLSGYTNAFLLLTLFRTALFAYHAGQSSVSSPKEKALLLIRFILPPVFAGFLITSSPLLLVFILVFLSDIFDRIRFYNDLRTPDPAKELLLQKL